MNPKVFAIVLNYNRAQDTVECVASIKNCKYRNLKILVVDNGSIDSSEEHIRAVHPDIEIVQTGRNLGFSGGNNVGIRYVLARNSNYILLINNDTLVAPDFLEKMIYELQRNRNAAAASGTIYYYPEKHKVWYAGGKFIPLRASSFTNHTFNYQSSSAVGDAQEVSFVSGCLMLLRTDVIKQIGFFDERFFMYLEDVEYSLRIIEAGYQLVYVPYARIYHKVHHRNDKPFPLYYGVRNRLLIASNFIHGWKKYVAIIYLLMTNIAKIAMWSIIRRDLAIAALFGISDYYRNNLFEGRGSLFNEIKY